VPWQHFDNLTLMAVQSSWTLRYAVLPHGRRRGRGRHTAVPVHVLAPLCKTYGPYPQIRPAALKQAVDFYEAKALDVLRL
jgi:hypothetical protein